MIRRAAVVTSALVALAVGVTPATASAARWQTLPGYDAPGTPGRYDKVRVLKQGPASADHVLVLIPGTSAGPLVSGWPPRPS